MKSNKDGKRKSPPVDLHINTQPGGVHASRRRLTPDYTNKNPNAPVLAARPPALPNFKPPTPLLTPGLTILSKSATNMTINTSAPVPAIPERSSTSAPNPPASFSASNFRVSPSPSQHSKKFFSDAKKKAGDGRTPISYSDAVLEDEKDSKLGLSIEELLEGGQVRAVMSDNCSTPSASSQTRWEHGFVEISDDKTVFRFFQETGKTKRKFLLSARKIGQTDYFISQYHSYPMELDKSGMPIKGSPLTKGTTPQAGGHRFCCHLSLNKCVAVVKQASRSFELWSKTCEKCDNELSKFSCGENLAGSQRRQLLAEIFHSEKVICAGDREITADARYIRIKIPHVSNKLVRSGWCERFPRSASNKGMQLASNLPLWNEKIQLSKLNGARATDAAPSLHDCLQYGKVKRGKFSLSYRFPVAAIQAFAVALSTYSWKKKS